MGHVLAAAARHVLSAVCVVVLLSIIAFSPAGAEQTAGEIVCVPNAVCRDAKTKLPLRALPRPFSNLYKSASAESSQILRENVPAFLPLYVFARPEKAATETGDEPTGWYQVGSSPRAPVGWMQARDVFEWRQALVVAYKHPGVPPNMRNRVLMFKDLPTLSGVVESPGREQAAKSIYDQLHAQTVPAGVVSSEPDRYLNIDEKFYILPILDFKDVAQFDDPAHYLLLAAAIPQARGQTGEAARDIKAPAVAPEAVMKELADLNVDVVFVIDMTASMQPFIVQTRRSVTDIARWFSRDAKISQQMRFGLVGYRDNVQLIPGLEWTTHNFTPALVDVNEFENVVGSANEATASSVDYPEEVYAGVKTGMESAWRPDSVRFMIQIGDASAHPPGHPQNTTGALDAPDFRHLLDQQKVTFFSIHLQDPRAEPDWAVAKPQFEALATNPGTDQPMYFPVPGYSPDNFDRVAKDVAGRISAILDPAQRQALARVVTGQAAAKPLAVPGDPAAGDQENAAKVTEAVAAALITYLGKEAKPPRDVKGWVFDHDIADPRITALDVRVLLSKKELNDLIIALDNLLDAMGQSKLTEQKLFAALQGIVSSTVKNPEGGISFANGQTLGDSRLMPEWIASLPYKSAVLSLTDESYAAMTADDRGRLEATLKGDLDFYQATNNNATLWQKLDPNDSDLESVAPIPLATLP